MSNEIKEAVLTTVEWVKSRYKYELDWINQEAFNFIDNRIDSDLGYLWQGEDSKENPPECNCDSLKDEIVKEYLASVIFTWHSPNNQTVKPKLGYLMKIIRTHYSDAEKEVIQTKEAKAFKVFNKSKLSTDR